jgi:Concanavalin A-like lectin/glucanases superfamily
MMLRPRALACTLLLAGVGHAAAPAHSDTIIWKLDRLDFAAGAPVQIVGKPAIRDVDGKLGVHFDGATDGLFVPTVPIARATAFTIEACFRPDAEGGAEQRFFHMEDDAGTRALLEIRMAANGQWALDTYLRSGETGLALLDRTKLHPSGQWHWVALTYDGKTMSSFVDGALELHGDVTFTPLKAAGQTSLGVRQNRVYWFKGSIRELRFHASALPAKKLQH